MTAESRQSDSAVSGTDNLTGRLPHGRCETGKRVYFKRRLADRAVERAAERGELPGLRQYECPKCGWWHLTSQEPRR